jgi:hypothetical protein
MVLLLRVSLGRAMAEREHKKLMLAEALRIYPTWGDAYIAEREWAEALAASLQAAEEALRRARRECSPWWTTDQKAWLDAALESLEKGKE